MNNTAKPPMLTTQSGFSLIELMVVVGIIGLLAAVAVPQFSKFQAKARQSEVKTNLSAIFTAEKGFFVEYTTYNASLTAIGFGVEGQNLRYNVGFDGVCAVYPPAGAIAVDQTGPTRISAVTVPAAPSFWNAAISGMNTTGVCAGPTFSAGGSGVPTSTLTAIDTWTITDQKILTNTANGIQ